MQISFVMLIFILLSDQISGGQSLRGGRPPAPPPAWKKASLLNRSPDPAIDLKSNRSGL